MVPPVADPEVLLIEEPPFGRRHGVGCRRRHVGGGDEIQLAELLRCRLIGRDRKIKKRRAVIGMIADGRRLPFAASALRNARDEAEDKPGGPVVVCCGA